MSEFDSADHAERAHSKFSASGSERWLNCAASVALEEMSPPSVDTFWSKEGTLAHEVLETMLLRKPLPELFAIDATMIRECEKVATKIRAMHRVFGGTLLIEKRVWAMFIHEEMFGTCDAIIAGDDGTLHIIDFKYGQGHIVSPVKNTQLIQYALSVAESYDWQFDNVKMWIMQPRAGANWFKSWQITMKELKEQWLPIWEKGVLRVEKGTSKPFAGNWCYWCRAKAICPAIKEKQVQKVVGSFNNLEESNHGFKEKSKTEINESRNASGKKVKGKEKIEGEEKIEGAKAGRVERQSQTQSKNGKAFFNYEDEDQSFGVGDFDAGVDDFACQQ